MAQIAADQNKKSALFHEIAGRIWKELLTIKIKQHGSFKVQDLFGRR